MKKRFQHSALVVSVLVLTLGPLLIAGCTSKHEYPGSDEAPMAMGEMDYEGGQPNAPLPRRMKQGESTSPSADAEPGAVAGSTLHTYGSLSPEGEPDDEYQAQLAPRTPNMDKDAYVANTYQGGSGQRDRLAKLVEDGVMVGEELIKLDTFAGQYSQPFAIPTKAALTVEAATERAKMIKAGGRTYLQVGIQAIDREAPKRPQLNICLVIDCSGSMSDEDKMQHARGAAIEVVGRLEKTDILSIVSYDDAPTVTVSAAKVSDKNELRSRIERLGPGGSTNIHAALEAGYAEVAKNLDPKAINEVILISDGEVTAGIEDLGSFARLTADAFDDGVQTTTVGMGLDYDADLMMTVARQGKGNYHFVRDAAAIQEIFKEELEDLTHVVAKALRLRIELADDVELVRVLGSAELTDEEVETVKHTERVQDERIRRELGITADRQDIEDEPGIKIVIPQFYMDDSHVVMLEIEVPKGSKERKIADVHLKYKDLVFAKNQDVTITATVQPAASEDVMLASTSQAVKKNVLGFQTGEALQKAAMFIDVGDYGKAAKVVDEQMVVLGVASEGWKDPDLDKDGALLAKYVSVIGSMNSQYSGDRELGVYLAKSLTYSAYQRTR